MDLDRRTVGRLFHSHLLLPLARLYISKTGNRLGKGREDALLQVDDGTEALEGKKAKGFWRGKKVRKIKSNNNLDAVLATAGGDEAGGG